MAKRINIQAIIQSQFMRDVPLVMAGCAIAALATDIFLIPNGLAAGGLTGLATIIAELGRRSGINLPDVDFYWKGGIVAPEFRRETLSMCSPLFEKCIIYDGGARRYEIHEHVEEVLEFWEGIKERADKIDFKELLDEKLGYPTPISYEDWIKANHYQKVRPADAKWLYRQELGYIESMKDITLKELAEQRIGEFTGALRKYILD
jgi:hypothetical protein